MFKPTNKNIGIGKIFAVIALVSLISPSYTLLNLGIYSETDSKSVPYIVDMTNVNSAAEPEPFSAAAHAPVVIDGNISLFSPKTGSGTLEDPYIIQNLEITSLTASFGMNFAFLISNTPEYVIVRNIIFEKIVSSVNDVRIFYVTDSDHVSVENIIIRHCKMTTPSAGFVVYMQNLENLALKSLSILNFTQNYVYGAYLYNCNNSIYEDISIMDCSGIRWDLWELNKCLNVTTKNMMITDFAVSILYGLKFSGGSINCIFHNCTIQYIDAEQHIAFFFSSSTVTNCIFRYCNFINSKTGYITENTLNGDYNQFIHNIIRNVTTESYIELFMFANSWGNNISNNIIDSITAQGSYLICFYLFDECERNLFFGNHITNINALVGDSYCINSRGPAIENIFCSNWFMSGSIIATDDGNNDYQGPVYVPSLGTEIYLGNYWCDYNFDENPEFHYWITPPREIDGNGNLSDPRPMHYFMMDFDNDGLMNFNENLIDTNVWDPDTDDDGVLDGVDPYPTGLDPTFFDSLIDFIRDPVNILLVGIVVLLVTNFILLIKKSKSSQSKGAKQSRNIEEEIGNTESKSEPAKSKIISTKK